jgi:hypothetical protein
MKYLKRAIGDFVSGMIQGAGIIATVIIWLKHLKGGL